MAIASRKLLSPVKLRRRKMASFGKFGIKIPKGHPVGKGSQQALLPSRKALDKLTKGTPKDKSVLGIEALTPSGRNAPKTYGGIQDLAKAGINLKKR